MLQHIRQNCDKFNTLSPLQFREILVVVLLTHFMLYFSADLALPPLPPLFCQFFENDFLLFHSPSIQFVGSWEIDVEPTDHSSRNLLFLSDKKKSEEHRAEQHLSSKPPRSLLCIVQKGSTFANCSIFRQNDGPVRSF